MDMMNVDASLIEEINHRIWKFSPFGRALPIEQTASAAAAAQEKLNAVWELVFTLPVYRELNIDKDCCYHTFERLLAKKDKWDQVKDEKSPGHHPSILRVPIALPDPALEPRLRSTHPHRFSFSAF